MDKTTCDWPRLGLKIKSYVVNIRDSWTQVIAKCG